MQGCLKGCLGFVVLGFIGLAVLVVIGSMIPKPTPEQIAANEAKSKADQAEREAKSEADRIATEKKSEAKRQRLQRELDAYQLGLKAAGVDSTLIANLSAKDDELTVTVQNGWHLVNKQIRLQMAQNLWKGWAAIHSPKEPDSAFIKLVDINGNSVGGSSFAGSLVSVP